MHEDHKPVFYSLPTVSKFKNIITVIYLRIVTAKKREWKNETVGEGESRSITCESVKGNRRNAYTLCFRLFVHVLCMGRVL